MPVRLPSITDLDSSQRKVVQLTPYDEPMFVNGPPGSGKTHISILRLNVMLQNGFTNVLFLLYNHSMYGFLKTIFRKMNIVNNIEIDTKDIFFTNLARSNGYNFNNEERGNKPGSYLKSYNQRLDFVNAVSDLNLPKYSAIIIDECQDFIDKEMDLLKKLTNKIIAVGDFDQTIYQNKPPSFLKALKSHRLNTIYRYGQNVASLAQNFAPESKNLSQNVTSLDKTEVFKVKSINNRDAISKIERILNAKKNTDLTVAIISMKKDVLSELKSVLNYKNINTFYCDTNRTMRDYDFDKNIPVLITPQSSKGMEFDCVILYGFDNSIKYFSLWKEIVYVSITRTCRELYLIEEPNTIRELANLPEWKSIDDSTNSTQFFDF